MRQIKPMQMPLTRAEAAADALRRRILDGVYPGGMPLRQAHLADEPGISRIPLREALVQLEAEGPVTATPHKGAVVAEVSEGDVSEQFTFRTLIEPELLKASGPNLKVEDYRQLHTEEAGTRRRAGRPGTSRRWLVTSRPTRPAQGSGSGNPACFRR